jgi:hypothetical protein
MPKEHVTGSERASTPDLGQSGSGDGPTLLGVTERMVGVHSIHTDYPLLPGDVMRLDSDGTYTKLTGIAIFGFELSADQAATLTPVEGTIVMDGNL